MPDRETGGAWQARRRDQLAQDIGARVGRVLFLAVDELAEYQARDALENPGELQVRPHTVETVRAFAQILEQQHRTIKVGHERRAEQAREYRQVAAEERTL